MFGGVTAAVLGAGYTVPSEGFCPRTRISKTSCGASMVHEPGSGQDAVHVRSFGGTAGRRIALAALLANNTGRPWRKSGMPAESEVG